MASRQKSSLRLERGAWQLEARTTAVMLLVLTLLGLLSCLCLTQATKVSTVQYSIWEKEAKRDRLQRENADLLAEVAEKLSVSQLEDLALRLGYVPAEERRYLDVPGYPADGVSGRGSDAVSRTGEDAVIASEEPRELGSSGVARWWEKVLSQFAAWAGTQP